MLRDKRSGPVSQETADYWRIVTFNEFIIFDRRCPFLLGALRNVHSQFGEDGILATLLDRFGARNRWTFEVGAADGETISCSAALREKGWNTVLIEADAEEYAALERIASDNVHCFHEEVGPDSLNRILAMAGAPKDLDVGILDVDGQEYYLWRGLTDFRPRIMVVEFAYPAFASGVLPELGGPGQASLDVIFDLAVEMGYDPICKTVCNLFCVDRAIWEDLKSVTEAV